MNDHDDTNGGGLRSVGDRYTILAAVAPHRAGPYIGRLWLLIELRKRGWTWGAIAAELHRRDMAGRN